MAIVVVAILDSNIIIRYCYWQWNEILPILLLLIFLRRWLQRDGIIYYYYSNDYLFFGNWFIDCWLIIRPITIVVIQYCYYSGILLSVDIIPTIIVIIYSIFIYWRTEFYSYDTSIEEWLILFFWRGLVFNEIQGIVYWWLAWWLSLMTALHWRWLWLLKYWGEAGWWRIGIAGDCYWPDDSILLCDIIYSILMTMTDGPLIRIVIDTLFPELVFNMTVLSVLTSSLTRLFGYWLAWRTDPIPLIVMTVTMTRCDIDPDYSEIDTTILQAIRLDPTLW